jgi:hypothetical protein
LGTSNKQSAAVTATATATSLAAQAKPDEVVTNRIKRAESAPVASSPKNSDSKDTEKTTNNQPAAAASSSSFWSFSGLFRSSADKKKEAKLGKKMEAYFDKAKGRWVFPGEEDKVEDDPGAAPPPMAMGAASTTSPAAGAIPGAIPGDAGGNSSSGQSAAERLSMPAPGPISYRRNRKKRGPTSRYAITGSFASPMQSSASPARTSSSASMRPGGGMSSMRPPSIGSFGTPPAQGQEKPKGTGSASTTSNGFGTPK